MRRWYLKTGIGPWSAGTQVEIVDEYDTDNPLDEPQHQTLVDFRVLAGNKPILRGLPKDLILVERRKRTDEGAIA